MTKATVVGIIAVMVCAGIVPCIDAHTVTTSTRKDSMMVSSEACGLRGYREANVRLSEAQCRSLQQSLTEFKVRLSQASSNEEVIRLFHEAVVMLDSYGLLPRGMSIPEAQRLVTRLPSHTAKSARLAGSNTSNALCLIAGNTNTTLVAGFPLCNLVCRTQWDFLAGLLELRNRFPLQLGSVVFMGGWGEFLWFTLGPAYGWVYSLGAMGVKNWTGTMHGNYPGNIIRFKSGDTLGEYPAIIGFTGINIASGDSQHFILGTAVAVGIVNT